MASVIEYQQQQISKLEDKVENLTNLIGNLNSTCALRHKTDLALALTHISKDVESLSRRVDDMENDINSLDKSKIEFEKKITELNAQINIIILKLDTITNTTQKNKETKISFLIQLVVIVLAALIIAIIGFIWSHAWNSIKNYSNNSNGQSINAPSPSISIDHPDAPGINKDEPLLKVP